MTTDHQNLTFVKTKDLDSLTIADDHNNNNNQNTTEQLPSPEKFISDGSGNFVAYIPVPMTTNGNDYEDEYYYDDDEYIDDDEYYEDEEDEEPSRPRKKAKKRRKGSSRKKTKKSKSNRR